MTSFTKQMIIDKLSQCMGVEKASETVNSLFAELGYTEVSELNGEQMVTVCDRMELEGGFMKMMASVLKIQALMEIEVT